MTGKATILGAGAGIRVCRGGWARFGIWESGDAVERKETTGSLRSLGLLCWGTPREGMVVVIWAELCLLDRAAWADVLRVGPDREGW